MPMHIIANHVYCIMKINQAILIFLAYLEKHGKVWVQGYIFARSVQTAVLSSKGEARKLIDLIIENKLCTLEE